MIFEKIFNNRDFTRESEVKIFIDELITMNPNLISAKFVPNDAFADAEFGNDVYKVVVCSNGEKIIHMKIDFSMFEKIGFDTVRNIEKKLIDFYKSDFRILTAIHYKPPICPHLHIVLKTKYADDSLDLFDKDVKRNFIILLMNIMKKAHINVLYFIKQEEINGRIIRTGIVETINKYLNDNREENA